MSIFNFLPTMLKAFHQCTLKDPGSGGTIEVRQSGYLPLRSAGAEARTLPRPTTKGALLLIVMETDGGDITLTVTGGYDEVGSTTFTFSDPQQALLLFSTYESATGTYAWRMMGSTSGASAFGPDVFSISSTSLVINDGSNDMDIRVESNALANFLNMDGSALLNGEISIGAAVPTNPQAMFALLPPANATGVTANQSIFHMQILPGGATVVPTGTAPVAASLNIHEPNLTATGTITAAATVRIVDAPTEGGLNYALWVDAGVSRFDGNIDISSAGIDMVAIANTATAFELTDGTTSLLALDTRNTVTVQNWILQAPAAQTLPNAATSRLRVASMPAKTVTLVGTTQVTTENLGAQLFIDAITYAQSGGAVTVDRVSGLHVGTPVAGASVTITANHIISTGTAGCFCTAAGVWTDTCGEAHKENILDVDYSQVVRDLEKVRMVTFNRKDSSDGGHTRYGVIAEQVPDFLASKDRTGVAAIDVASFALASAQLLKRENDELRGRLESLEAKLA